MLLTLLLHLPLFHVSRYSSFLAPLVTLVSYECGVSTTPVRLHKQVLDSQLALAHIVVLDEHHFERFLDQEHRHNEEFLPSGALQAVLEPLVTKNEMEWRSAVHEEASDDTHARYRAVDVQRRELCRAMEAEYGLTAAACPTQHCKYDTVNNTVYLMKKPATGSDETRGSERSEKVSRTMRYGGSVLND